MQLAIQSVTPTKSGKSLVVKAGGKDYFAKTASGIQAGMTIEAETEDSEYQGKTNTWINKWKAVAVATPAPQSGTSASALASQLGANWLPFASNTVAHAISAGLITEPSQIKKWVVAAKDAAENPIPF